jgi:uncharacterized protein
MTRKLFVNIAVADLPRSISFFEALGFVFDPQFTDDSATCMIVNADAAFMLLTRDRFRDFTAKELGDPASSAQAIYCLSADSRSEVDAVVDAALDAGATVHGAPQDHGFMYGRSFCDLDGHAWEVMWLDVAAAQAC